RPPLGPLRRPPTQYPPPCRFRDFLRGPLPVFASGKKHKLFIRQHCSHPSLLELVVGEPVAPKNTVPHGLSVTPGTNGPSRCYTFCHCPHLPDSEQSAIFLSDFLSCVHARVVT